MSPAETVTRVLNGLYKRSDRPAWFAKRLETLASIHDNLEGGIETVVLLIDLAFGPGVPPDIAQEVYYMLTELAPKELYAVLSLRLEVAKIVRRKP